MTDVEFLVWIAKHFVREHKLDTQSVVVQRLKKIAKEISPPPAKKENPHEQIFPTV